MKLGRLNEPSFYMDAAFPLCVCLDFFLPSLEVVILQSMPDKDLESEARKRVGNADVAEKSSTEATCFSWFLSSWGGISNMQLVHVMCMYILQVIYIIYYKFWLKSGRKTSYNLGDLRSAYVPLSAVPVFCRHLGLALVS